MYHNEATAVIFTQFISVLLLALLGWVLGGEIISGSLAIGAGICFIANLCLYKSVFRHKGAPQAKAIVRGLYVGEMLKIILTFSLFLFVLRYMIWVSMLYLFVGYIVLQLTFWVVPVFFGLKKMRKGHNLC
jgi:F0F1-type ATP synthase assembly protein I